MVGSLDTIDIGSVVTDEYLLDFLVLYESLVETWTSYPFVLHAFVVEDQVAQRLAGTGLENMEIHRLPGEAGDWRQNASRRIDLVEQAGLERCIVSDADNVFLDETPELALLLDGHEFVFVGGPTVELPIQTSIWSFRRSERSIEFARRWRAESRDVDSSDASRVLARLLEDEGFERAVEVPSSYGVDVDLPALALEHDELGFREQHTGRVKLLHLAGLRARGHRSLADRIGVMVDCFPQMAPVLPLYALLAERAAARLDIESVANPNIYVRSRLLDAGILPTRNQLPELLNRRGLADTGVEVGVKMGVFSDVILRRWHGRTLISVDPWIEAPRDEYEDVSNVGQAKHERFYEEALKRLEKYGERSVIWRMTSTDAAARVEPRTLDFVYLDARHDYDSVKEDLENWFDKIRPGGVFAGHDYLDGVRPEGSFGVKSAVDEFFAARGLPVKTTYVDQRWSSWLVEIPA